MPAESNVGGMARLSYIVAGAALASWGLWGADLSWTMWTWLSLGGVLLILGLIGYSPLHALIVQKHQKVS
jgi:Protein of unknown function (DUF2892)